MGYRGVLRSEAGGRGWQELTCGWWPGGGTCVLPNSGVSQLIVTVQERDVIRPTHKEGNVSWPRSGNELWGGR